MYKKIFGLRATGVIWLVIALIANGLSLRMADAQVTSLDSDLFALGTDVSDAFSGVTLQTMSLTPALNAPSPQGPFTTMDASYAPVYAVAGNYFSPSPTSNGWGFLYGGPLGVYGTGNCFQQCNVANIEGQLTGPGLLINFNSPVNEVSVSQLGNSDNGVTMEAFNSANREVGYCAAAPGGGINPGQYQCYSAPGMSQVGTDTFTVLSPPELTEEWQVVTTISAADISKVLVAGYNNGGDEINTIRYSAPEIGTDAAASGLTFLLGGLLVMRGRRVRAPMSMSRE